MIEIKPDGSEKALDLYPDTSIDITLENPLLGDTERLVPGSFSLPFTVPGGDASPDNAASLNNPDVIEIAQVIQPVAASLIVDNIPFRKGKLKVDATNGNNINTYFLFNLSQLRDDIKTKKLRELLDEEIVLFENSFTKTVSVWMHEDDVLHEIIINGKTYKNIVPEGATPRSKITDQIMADAAASDGSEYLAYIESSTPTDGEGYYTFTFSLRIKEGASYIPTSDPFIKFEVNAILSEGDVIAVGYNFKITSNFYEYHDEVADALDPFFTSAHEKIRFPWITNTAIHSDNKTISSNGAINYYAEDRPFLSSKWNPDHIEGLRQFYSIQPFIRMGYVLEVIAQWLGVTFEGDFMVRAQKMLIDNNTILDRPQAFLHNNIITIPFLDFEVSYIYQRQYRLPDVMFYDGIINLMNLVPDITVIDFLKAFCVRYNLSCDYNEVSSKIFLNYRESIARSSDYINIDSVAGRVQEIQNNAIRGYRIVVPKEPGDDLSFEESITVGDAEEEIVIPCGRLMWDDPFVGLGRRVRILRKVGAPWGLRTMYYTDNLNGTTKAGIRYPATDGNPEYVEDIIALHERHHKYWMLFYKNKRTITIPIAWELSDILKLEWAKKHRYDRSDFLIKAIKLRITMRGLQVSEAELITMR